MPYSSHHSPGSVIAAGMFSTVYMPRSPPVLLFDHPVSNAFPDGVTNVTLFDTASTDAMRKCVSVQKW